MQRQPQLCHSWARRWLVLQPFLLSARGVQHYSLQCCAHCSPRKSPRNSWVCLCAPKSAFLLKLCSLIAKCRVQEYQNSSETLEEERGSVGINRHGNVEGTRLRKKHKQENWKAGNCTAFVSMFCLKYKAGQICRNVIYALGSGCTIHWVPFPIVYDVRRSHNGIRIL